jgi:hypothetical protein
MPASEAPTDDPPLVEPRPSKPSVAALLTAAALGCFVIYVTTVLSDVVPVQPLEPQWQRLFVGSVLNNVGFPLIGLVLIHLARYLLPEQPDLARLTKSVQHLAAAAALLLVLLIPLHAAATLNILQGQAATQGAQLRQAEQRYGLLRQVILGARNPKELQQNLALNDGPRLASSDLTRPLPQLRADLLAGLAQARTEARRQLEGPRPAEILTGIAQILRIGIIAAFMAIAFAAGARRPGADQTLLGEWTEARRRRLMEREARLRAIREQEREWEAQAMEQWEEMERLQHQRRLEPEQRENPGSDDTARQAPPREKHRLWTHNQTFDDYYREIGPQEEDLTGPDPQDPRP